MKKYIILLFLFSSFQVLSQRDSLNYFPSEGDFGVGLNVNGLIGNIGLGAVQDNFGNDLIFARYFLSDKNALRFGFGADLDQYKRTVTDSLGAALRNFDSSYVQPSFHFNFGIEKHLFYGKRLDPYFGAGVVGSIIGRSREQTSLSLEDTTGVFEVTTDLKSSGGFVLGVNAVAGFNYFIAENFAFGAEYTLSYAYQQVGGDFDRVVITTPVTGQSSSRRELGSDLTRRNTINMSGQLDIRLSYYFPTRSRGS